MDDDCNKIECSGDMHDATYSGSDSCSEDYEQEPVIRTCSDGSCGELARSIRAHMDESDRDGDLSSCDSEDPRASRSEEAAVVHERGDRETRQRVRRALVHHLTMEGSNDIPQLDQWCVDGKPVFPELYHQNEGGGLKEQQSVKPPDRRGRASETLDSLQLLLLLLGWSLAVVCCMQYGVPLWHDLGLAAVIGDDQVCLGLIALATTLPFVGLVSMSIDLI